MRKEICVNGITLVCGFVVFIERKTANIMTSFYDLNYIIELNEKRLEQYDAAYQKIVNQFTILLVIYSAFAFFLIPVIEALYSSGASFHWLYHASFYLCSFLVSYSLFYTVRFLMPKDVSHLLAPQEYYEIHREKCERETNDKQEVDMLLKAAYIDELELAVNTNKLNVARKIKFYRKAFSLAMWAIIPYLVCVGFHVCMKQDSIYKVEIINKFINFIKTNEDGER